MTPEISELADRAWKLATAPTIAPSSVYANTLRECAEMLRRSSERIAVVQGDLDRESKEAESYHAFWIEERSKRIAAEAAVKAERERCAKIAEDQAIAFLSPEYASEQPLGSFCERFACERVAEAIRASVSGSTEGGNG